MKDLKFALLFIAILCSTEVYGQQKFDNFFIFHTDAIGKVYLDMPLLTMPSQQQAYNTTGGFFSSYMNPGMENTLSYSTDLYTAGHFGIKKGVHFKKSEFLSIFTQKLAIAAFDIIVMQMPLGVSWTHEEYHRAVMTQYGIDSYDEVLLFKLGSSTIAVSHVTDEGLAMICDEHRPDFVRLMSAGHEAVVELNRNMQSNQFYYHQNLDNEIGYWINTFQNFLYIATCANGNGDEGMRERNEVETTIASRDFTGMDMNAWVYELCNPDLPYDARGVHPSGVGINRYIMYDDISDQGKSYLKRQLRLDVLNFISPMMLGFSRFRLAQTEKGAYYGNFAFRHYLTSFGSDSSLDLYLQTPRLNLYTTFHVYDNYEHTFGGFEVGLIDFPLLDNKMLVGGSLMGWIQPAQQSFFTSDGTFGGLIKARAAYHWRFMEPYAELGWKSAGWVASNVNLGEGFFMKAGIRWQISY